MTKKYILITLLCTAWVANAQKSLPEKTFKNVSFVVVPNVYYSPETRFGGGIAGIYLFKTDSTTRTSNLDFGLLYTQRKQLIFEPIWNIFTKRERFFVKGIMLYTHFPDYFFGVGNKTTLQNREQIDYKIFRLHNQVFHQLKKGIFVGLQYQLFHTYDVRFAENTMYLPSTLEGYKGSFSSGLGYDLLYDTRDNITNPQKGVFIEVSNLIYSKFLGSSQRFSNYLFDYRQYFPLKNKAVIATQMLTNLNFGAVPFRQMATIGGANTMRGYYTGHFRDKNLLALQAEYRQQIGKTRFGYTVFGGAANVSNSVKTLLTLTPKYSLGVGLRIRLSKKENVNVRGDAGFGQKSKGLYGNFGEAF